MKLINKPTDEPLKHWRNPERGLGRIPKENIQYEWRRTMGDQSM